MGVADVIDGEETTRLVDSGDGGETTLFEYVLKASLGSGKGRFSAAVALASLSDPNLDTHIFVGTLFLSDLNRDGFPDIVAAARTSSQLSVLLHQADGGYHATLYSFPDPVTAVALPRQGRAPDLIVAYDETIQILTNAGDGTFSMGPAYDVPNLAQELTIADFNGDCIPDVAVGAGGCAQGAGVSVLLGDADGGFGAPQSLPTDVSQASTGQLTVLGPTASPRALAALIVCSGAHGLVVYGDASSH